MRKRVLFVDDEVLVLQGLQRALRGLRDEWDMVFLPSAPEALARMEQEPFDVIVSDLQMPGMNGAELLARVKSLYPGTVRLALSGHADQDTALECLEVAHQYLSKPCDHERLKARLRQAGTLGSGLADQSLKQLVSRIDRLPALPTLYLQLTEALASDRAGAERIGGLIGQDPGMTAKLLHLANSAFFALQRPLSDAVEAVARLGVETVRSLALAQGVFGQAGSLATRALSLEQLWTHSLGVATGARAIARLEGASETEAEEAFTAGLLHDLGILVLAWRLGDPYEEVIRGVAAEHAETEDIERRVFGATHSEVGSYLIGLWGLPPRVVQAAAWHHSPSWSGETAFTPLTAVHAADALGGSAAHHPLFERAILDHYHLRVVGKQDRLPLWKEALGREAHRAEEPL